MSEVRVATVNGQHDAQDYVEVITAVDSVLIPTLRLAFLCENVNGSYLEHIHELID